MLFILSQKGVWSERDAVVANFTLQERLRRNLFADVRVIGTSWFSLRRCNCKSTVSNIAFAFCFAFCFYVNPDILIYVTLQRSDNRVTRKLRENSSCSKVEKKKKKKAHVIRWTPCSKTFLPFLFSTGDGLVR